MWIATVTSKGQLTILKELRERLGLREQDQVILALEEHGVVLTPLRRPTVASLAGRLAGGPPYPGLEAMREQVRRDRAERFTAGPSPARRC